MIFYPLQTLLDAGINEIMIVSGKRYAGHFLELIGSGFDWGVRFTCEIQDEARGIAQAPGLLFWVKLFSKIMSVRLCKRLKSVVIFF